MIGFPVVAVLLPFRTCVPLNDAYDAMKKKKKTVIGNFVRFYIHGRVFPNQSDHVSPKWKKCDWSYAQVGKFSQYPLLNFAYEIATHECILHRSFLKKKKHSLRQLSQNCIEKETNNSDVNFIMLIYIKVFVQYVVIHLSRKKIIFRSRRKYSLFQNVFLVVVYFPS